VDRPLPARGGAIVCGPVVAMRCASLTTISSPLKPQQCRRKCCNGECPPCPEKCGRDLNCRNHKCAFECHEGLCFPCQGIYFAWCA
jgi:hypothetical protein